MSLITINSTALTPLTGYDVEWYDLSMDSGRNANGDMKLNIVNNKYKVILHTPYMTQTQLTAFFTNLGIGTLSVTFYNPFIGTTSTKNMYRGDRKISLYWDKTEKLYSPMDISLIEL